MINKGWSVYSFVFFVFVVAGIVLCSQQYVHADGKYFPEKAYKVAPAIPSQRAILVYKDGIERLTIESALDGQGQKFGWIIPLPAKPTEFQSTSTGLINTFSLVVQPDIIHDLRRELSTLWRGAVLITLICLIMVGTKPPQRILLLISLLIFSIVIFTPSLGRHSAELAFTHTPGIQVYDVKEIGSYDLAVLEAESSKALDGWLEGNHFVSLTKKEEKIISDYIGCGWCFVAAKLRRQNDGYSRPHPLSMSFASNKPIYPIKLTATTGSDVFLELFVISDRQAVCKELTLEVSDTYRFIKKYVGSSSTGTIRSGFDGKTYHQDIGHSESVKLMWDGCVLSKLCGTLEPKQMRQDIVLQLKTTEPHQPHQECYYSRRGAIETALVLFLRIWCILPIALSVVFSIKKKEWSGKGRFVKRALAPMLLFSLLVCAVTYAVLPKVNVRILGGKRGSSLVRFMLERGERAVELSIFTKDHDDFAGMSKDEIAELLRNFFASKDMANIYTGEPIKEEDSPGNYSLIEDDRGIVWRTYSKEGYPEDCVLVPAFQD